MIPYQTVFTGLSNPTYRVSQSQLCLNVRLCMFMCVHMCLRLGMCIFVRVCVRICVCTFAFIERITAEELYLRELGVLAIAVVLLSVYLQV